jgi:hypothetical protein
MKCPATATELELYCTDHIYSDFAVVLICGKKEKHIKQ